MAAKAMYQAAAMKRKLAYWKTYVGRPEEDWARRLAMNQLGRGLYLAGHDEDALSVQEAELSMLQRRGASERDMLAVQSNLASTYGKIGQSEQALQLKRDVYSGYLKLYGEEHKETLIAAFNYVLTLGDLERWEDAKALIRKTIPVARRTLGDNYEMTLSMRKTYALALCCDGTPSLGDLREAVNTLEDVAPTARRVLGGAHPTVVQVESYLQHTREMIHAREASPGAA